MKAKTSLLWQHCKEKADAGHLVVCNYCAVEIKRGKAGSNRAGWTLKNFQYHLEKKHPDVNQLVKDKQAIDTKIDPKDETVRGTVPLFNLRNHKERQSFLKKVRV
jgi:hypothetical protein